MESESGSSHLRVQSKPLVQTVSFCMLHVLVIQHMYLWLHISEKLNFFTTFFTDCLMDICKSNFCLCLRHPPNYSLIFFRSNIDPICY